MVGVFNLDNLLKFISLRLHDGAQMEIQKALSHGCLRVMQKEV